MKITNIYDFLSPQYLINHYIILISPHIYLWCPDLPLASTLYKLDFYYLLLRYLVLSSFSLSEFSLPVSSSLTCVVPREIVQKFRFQTPHPTPQLWQKPPLIPSGILNQGNIDPHPACVHSPNTTPPAPSLLFNISRPTLQEEAFYPIRGQARILIPRG